MSVSVTAAFRRRVRSLASLMAVGAAMTACGESTTPLLEFVTLSVAPNRMPCVGVVPTTCLVVRRLPDSRDEYFYDTIGGFTFEPGYRQVIKVRVYRIPDPPADGSSLAYVLVRVLERRPEAVIE